MIQIAPITSTWVHRPSEVDYLTTHSPVKSGRPFVYMARMASASSVMKAVKRELYLTVEVRAEVWRLVDLDEHALRLSGRDRRHAREHAPVLEESRLEAFVAVGDFAHETERESF